MIYRLQRLFTSSFLRPTCCSLSLGIESFALKSLFATIKLTGFDTFLLNVRVVTRSKWDDNMMTCWRSALNKEQEVELLNDG